MITFFNKKKKDVNTKIGSNPERKGLYIMASLVHVTYKEDDGKWHVRKANSSRSVESFKTQKEAIAAGKKYALETAGSLSIHGEDGKIQKGYSYEELVGNKKTTTSKKSSTSKKKSSK